MRLMNFLKRPFPVIDDNRNKFAAAFSFGAFIFLFLYIFKPFGLDIYTGQQIFFHTLGFGGITFAVMFLNLMVLDRFFPSFFKDESWTIGKEIFITLIYIALIGLSNYLFAVWLSITKPTLKKFLYLEGVSLCLAVFPVIVWTLIRENMLLRHSRREIEKFDPVLHPDKKKFLDGTHPEVSAIPEPYNHSSIILSSETEANAIKADPANVYFITAADNYIKVYVDEGKSLNAVLLRSSLKRAEEDLSTHPQFFRCHRAYIINLRKVQSVSGNARGLKLKLKGCPDQIPVSRSLNDQVREKLQQILSHQ